MGKSRGNAITLRATADETARLIRRARTDAERRITYEPERRPEVSNLVLLAALCRGEAPEAVAARGRRRRRERAEGARDRGGQRAPRARARPPRRGRRATAAYLRGVLREGNERARAIAADTLAEVRRLMHTDYGT